MSEKLQILVICRHNAGRSQMVAAYLQRLGGTRIDVDSAGLEAGDSVNPLVVEVMREDGFDLADKKPQSLFTLSKSGRTFHHTITVCNEADENCPIFAGATERWHAPFPDPAKVTGSRAEQLAEVRRIRDLIKDWVYHPGPDDFVAKNGLLS